MDGTTLRLQAPETVRGGLFFQARVDVDTTEGIAEPRIVLGDGWLEGLQATRSSRPRRASRVATGVVT